MRKIFLGLSFFLSISVFGQGNIERNYDPLEVRLYNSEEAYHAEKQMSLSNTKVWKNFQSVNPKWSSLFNERTGMPSKAFGNPIAAVGSSDTEKAISFLHEMNQSFSAGAVQISARPEVKTSKFTNVVFDQTFNGMKVLFSKSSVKLVNGKVVQFAYGVHPNIQLEDKPVIGLQQARLAALQGITTSIEIIRSTGEISILPVPQANSFEYRKIYIVTVSTRNSQNVPQRYLTYIDAITGKILMRKNLVCHAEGGPKKPGGQELVVDVQVNGNVYMTNPYGVATNEGLNNIYVTVGGTDYTSDINGSGTLPVNAGTNAIVRLEGPWSTVNTNGTVPQKNITLQAGLNTIDMNTAANIRELSAYKSVNRIHDHCKSWMPTFTGMDFQLPTNIDLTSGDCNAFYDGSSINFYAIGNGCNATSLLSDVVFHEYGHGINDNYYQSQSSYFFNGAINEGYADYWGISLGNSPVVGVGFYTDNEDGIRRYDTERKVYPQDLVGQVHADGEIIMGAWYDTHLLMGGDWNATMPLFVEAYAGLQAETADGNEGEAFTDILLDVLLADDNDGDITNGTPNGNAIVQGFYLHGITLISPAVLNHTDELFGPALQTFELTADLDLFFPYTQYLEAVNCHYQFNNGTWQMTPMNIASGSYVASFPAQPVGTILKYYFTATDSNGSIGSVLPTAAHLQNFAAIPFIRLIGVDEVGRHDCDNNEDWGTWSLGIAGDNATTGIWDLEIPIESVTVDVSPGTIVQTGTQVTPGGEYCFFTANDPTQGGIGVADVDGGRTTLQSTTIDLSSYANPIVSYYRWYTNSPPGGANPNADYWQVRMSNNNGATWTYVENTLTSDMRWRRNAFHVSDYMPPTNQMKFQFIASDSLRPNVNLNGGSLVEAALDDFIVYDDAIIGVDEVSADVEILSVFPNPTTSNINVQFALNTPSQVEFIVTDATGRTIYSIPASSYGTQLNHVLVPVEKWAKGTYQVLLRSNKKILDSITFMKE
ncbi:MAG: T9SS type A sorting domain-containing protein [Bacteroidetes bacterium]|nr:T9SS type A sorting domain-containing protein [Bacteroidota bacterium]